MSVEAWVSLIVMALFNVLSTAFYIGVNKQMLSEVMRRVAHMEQDKAEKEYVSLHIERLAEEHDRMDREVNAMRQDVKNLLQRRGVRDAQ